MPTWTSNVTNVPDIQRKKQSFDDALNSINQFAGIMHQFQQAKQAENINKLTLGLKFADMYEGDAKHNALKELDQVIFDVTNKRVNWDALKPVDMDTATKSMMNIINNKKLSPVEQAGAMETFLRNFKPDVAKRLTEAVNQQQLKENVATLQGQPTQVPFATGVPTEQTPEFRFRTALDIPTPQSKADALNALRLSEEGRKVMETLIPKEKTPSVQKLFNKDTGRSVSLDLTNPDQYKLFFELQGKGWEADRRPDEKAPPEIKLDNYIETALAGHYPDFINNPTVRKEAYSKFATDKKFKSQIIGEAGQMARDRAPISNVYLQTTEGLLAGKTKGAPRLVPIETPSGESISKPLPNAAQDKLSALKEIRDTLDSVRDQYKKTPGVVGPVSGAYGETLGRILPTPEGYENLRSEINKLFDVVYAKSGKQINQYEAKIIQNYLLKMSNKPETFETNLRNLYRHLDSLEKSVTEQYGEQGYKTSTKQTGTAEGFLKKKGLIK